MRLLLLVLLYSLLVDERERDADREAELDGWATS